MDSIIFHKKLQDYLTKDFVPIIFGLLIMFIQTGHSYYLSTQVAALMFVFFIIWGSGCDLKISPLALITALIFLVVLLWQTYKVPEAISRNSNNIYMTTAGVYVYAILMLGMTCLHPARPNYILDIYRKTAAFVILFTAIAVLIVDIRIFPAFSRDEMMKQNAFLVTNYSSTEEIEKNITNRKLNGLHLAMDLFYGEPSFLSLIIFVCLISYLTCCKGQMIGAKGLTIKSKSIILCGWLTMLYINSLSGLCYAICFLSLIDVGKFKKQEFGFCRNLEYVVYIFLGVSVVLAFIFYSEYYSFRLVDMSNSLSLSQRFGVFLNMSLEDYIFGIQSARDIPIEGFHNGLLYLMMIGGCGGILYITYMLCEVISVGKNIKMPLILFISTLAIFCQNGGVFSPNKLVILSFLLVPLCCIKSIMNKG